MPVFLQALAVRFFRGIGPDTAKLGPFKEFNFFVGANNSGKSTVLDLIHRFLSQGSKERMPEKLDEYKLSWKTALERRCIFLARTTPFESGAGDVTNAR